MFCSLQPAACSAQRSSSAPHVCRTAILSSAVFTAARRAGASALDMLLLVTAAAEYDV